MKSSVATIIAALSSTVLAHGGVRTYTIDGTKYPG